MKKIIAKLLGSAAIVVGTITAGVVAAAPANAATSDCPSGASCFWRDQGFVTNGIGSDWIAFQQYLPTFVGTYYTCRSSGCTNGGNDSASSIFNNGNSCISYFYRDASYGTLAIIFDKKAGLTNLASTVWNDQLSSGKFIC